MPITFLIRTLGIKSKLKNPSPFKSEMKQGNKIEWEKQTKRKKTLVFIKPYLCVVRS
jgi:hypothetical protein